MAKNVHAGHRSRMRGKLLEHGAAGFQDHELIEMLLYYCIPVKNTNEMAHKMLDEYKTMTMLVESDPNDMMRRTGVSENIAVFFALVSEIIKRANSERWTNKTVISSSNFAGEYAVALLCYEKRECFYVISLDSQNRLINATLVARGTVDEAHIYPRVIVETVLRHNASSVILAHNHPGGSTKASISDINTTMKIVNALNSIGITVLDHIIVADNKFTSMVSNNLMTNCIQ